MILEFVGIQFATAHQFLCFRFILHKLHLEVLSCTSMLMSQSVVHGILEGEQRQVSFGDLFICISDLNSQRVGDFSYCHPSSSVRSFLPIRSHQFFQFPSHPTKYNSNSIHYSLTVFDYFVLAFISLFPRLSHFSGGNANSARHPSSPSLSISNHQCQYGPRTKKKPAP